MQETHGTNWWQAGTGSWQGRLPSSNATRLYDYRFKTLAARWKNETALESSIDKIVLNHAYQQIIGMGPEVLPLLLKELAEEPDHWFWALAAISGKNPVPKEHAGKIDLMAADWLAFGKTRGWIIA